MENIDAESREVGWAGRWVGLLKKHAKIVPGGQQEEGHGIVHHHHVQGGHLQ